MSKYIERQTNEMTKPEELVLQRGEVFYITSVFDTVGSEQRSGRPAVVVSNNHNNKHSDVVEICYLTLQDKKPLPTHVKVPDGACSNSTVLCEQVTSVSKQRIGDYMCRLSDAVMDKVDRAILASLDLEYLLDKNSPKFPATPVPDNSAEVAKLKDEVKKLTDELVYLRDRAEKSEVYERMYNDLLDKLIKR